MNSNEMEISRICHKITSIVKSKNLESQISNSQGLKPSTINSLDDTNLQDDVA